MDREARERARRLQERIDRVMWGRSYASVQDGDGRVRDVVLRSLTANESNRLNFLYDKEKRLAVEAGLLPEEELATILESQGTWTSKDEVRIHDLERKIALFKDQVRQFQFMKARLAKAKRDLEAAESEIRELSNLRGSVMALSAEGRAEEVKRRHMVFMASEKDVGIPMWDSLERFLDEDDLVLVYNSAIAYYANNVMNEAETREVARSGPWRYRWGAAKNGADLFGRPVSEWTESQCALVYWSQFYDYVFESLDRPNAAVVDDDDACDAWYEQQSKKHAAKGDEKRNLLGTKKAKTSKFHQEQFVMVDPGDKEAVKEVQDMNAPSTRAALRREREMIKKSGGRVSEWKLRGAPGKATA